MSAETRDDGFYWIKIDQVGWLIGEWTTPNTGVLGYWALPGYEENHEDGWLEQIDERKIVNPNE
jgi:hypothetical protein